MKTRPYRGSLKYPWTCRQSKGYRKWLKKQANQKVRNHSKEAIRRYQNDDTSDYNDFVVGVGYWD
jgi:hypothetical protein